MVLLGAGPSVASRHVAKSLPDDAIDQPRRTAGANAVPVWHPLALVALIVSVAVAGRLLPANAHELHGRGEPIAGAYVPMLLVNWGLLLYVCRVGRPRFAFAELAGLRAYTPRRAVGDAALALLVAACLFGGETAWEIGFGSPGSSATDALLPSTLVERIVWCAVAVSVGISEELVYRGYLATELARVTTSPLAGLLGQALLFAVAHAEQGGTTMLRFFVYAVGLGVLAIKRGSLVPGMLAHAGIDLYAGLSH